MPQIVEYAYGESDRTDPRWYENQPNQHDPDEATVWTLHMILDPDAKRKALQIVSLLPEPTGEYVWDNADVWGEPYTSTTGDQGHLAIYFRAIPPTHREVGEAIFRMIEASASVTDFSVSTAGDWSA